MTASESLQSITGTSKYYFRKKPSTSSSIVDSTSGGSTHAGSSAESIDSEESHRFAASQKPITLHIITAPGQSEDLRKCFHGLVSRLDPNIDVVTVSEAKNPRRTQHDHHAANGPDVPSIGILLFFLEPDSNDKRQRLPGNNARRHPVGEFTQVRQIFSRAPWSFHHRVAISGKLMTCESNTQDYFKYSPNSSPRSRDSGRATPMPSLNGLSKTEELYPIWGVRKVHYGKQILRISLFTSAVNWEDQVKFYRLILRCSETTVRDDFCYFPLPAGDVTEIQFALKKLPRNLKPKALHTSLVQFPIANIGQLVPLLPNPCQQISARRWRTRDHDGNAILLQVQQSGGGGAENESQFLDKAFSDLESPAKTRTASPPPDANKARNGKPASANSSRRSSKSADTVKVNTPSDDSTSSCGSASPRYPDVTAKPKRQFRKVARKLEYFSMSDSPCELERSDEGVFV